MLAETEWAADERAENKGQRSRGRRSAKLWVAITLAGTLLVGVWLMYSARASGSSAAASAPTLPQVVVSKPLSRDILTRLGFLGQFAAVSQVELRAQVGATLPPYAHSGPLAEAGRYAAILLGAKSSKRNG